MKKFLYFITLSMLFINSSHAFTIKFTGNFTEPIEIKIDGRIYCDITPLVKPGQKLLIKKLGMSTYQINTWIISQRPRIVELWKEDKRFLLEIPSQLCRKDCTIEVIINDKGISIPWQSQSKLDQCDQCLELARTQDPMEYWQKKAQKYCKMPLFREYIEKRNFEGASILLVTAKEIDQQNSELITSLAHEGKFEEARKLLASLLSAKQTNILARFLTEAETMQKKEKEPLKSIDQSAQEPQLSKAVAIDSLKYTWDAESEEWLSPDKLLQKQKKEKEQLSLEEQLPLIEKALQEKRFDEIQYLFSKEAKLIISLIHQGECDELKKRLSSFFKIRRSVKSSLLSTATDAMQKKEKEQLKPVDQSSQEPQLPKAEIIGDIKSSGDEERLIHKQTPFIVNAIKEGTFDSLIRKCIEEGRVDEVHNLLKAEIFKQLKKSAQADEKEISETIESQQTTSPGKEEVTSDVAFESPLHIITPACPSDSDYSLSGVIHKTQDDDDTQMPEKDIAHIFAQMNINQEKNAIDGIDITAVSPDYFKLWYLRELRRTDKITAMYSKKEQPECAKAPDWLQRRLEELKKS